MSTAIFAAIALGAQAIAMPTPAQFGRVPGRLPSAPTTNVLDFLDASGNGLPRLPEGLVIRLLGPSLPMAPTTGEVPYSCPADLPTPAGYGIGIGPVAPLAAIRVPDYITVWWLNDGTFVVLPSGTVVWATGAPQVAEWPREELR